MGRRAVVVPASAVSVPPLAWPTLLLFAACVAAWSLALCGGAALGWPLALTLPVQAAAAFAVFTPLHDATHGAAAHGHRALNNAVGRIAGLILAAPYMAFRFVHLEHHKHTNDPEKDPDMWSGTGPAILMPLRWLSQVRRRERETERGRGRGKKRDGAWLERARGMCV